MRVLFIDCETGGIDIPEENSTLSLGCVVWEDGEILDSKEFFILWPVLKITPGSLRINKMNMLEFIEKAKSPDVVRKEFFTFIFNNFGNKYPIPLGGHNTKFDAIHLKHLIGNKKYNRMFLCRLRDTSSNLLLFQDIGIYPKENSTSLEDACSYYGISIRKTGKHVALEDALASAFLYNELINQIRRIKYE